MFTIEMDFDEISITILDDSGQHEDMQTFIYDDIVYIKQWNEEANKFNVIAITPKMFHEMIASIDQTEGAYHIR
jgi:hypothetical protein